MKIILQRVTKASVTVDNITIGQIDQGYLLLVGFEQNDSDKLILPMLEKLKKLKLFAGADGLFSRSLEEVEGSLLIISQFTLSANLKKGKKPSFSRALEPAQAEIMYDKFVNQARELFRTVEEGKFGARMMVSLTNDGPVTLILESDKLFPALYQ